MTSSLKSHCVQSCKPISLVLYGRRYRLLGKGNATTESSSREYGRYIYLRHSSLEIIDARASSLAVYVTGKHNFFENRPKVDFVLI
jgi:hypothetical protein